MKYKRVAILIPCHNEEKGIGKVIDSIPVKRLRTLGYIAKIIVIDNNSTDRTRLFAKERNVEIVTERRKGKGNALKAGFKAVPTDTHYIVMLDGDNTYKAKEIPRLLEPLHNNFCEVVVGSRLGGKMKKDSLKFTNRVFNWSITFMVRQIYRANVTDVLSGFFAWKRNVITDLAPYLKSDGFAIEIEMITKMIRMKHEMYSVPITYDQREGKTKIDSVRDATKILITFLQNLNWNPDKKRVRKSLKSKFKLREPYVLTNEDLN